MGKIYPSDMLVSNHNNDKHFNQPDFNQCLFSGGYDHWDTFMFWQV